MGLWCDGISLLPDPLLRCPSLSEEKTLGLRGQRLPRQPLIMVTSLQPVLSASPGVWVQEESLKVKRTEISWTRSSAAAGSLSTSLNIYLWVGEDSLRPGRSVSLGSLFLAGLLFDTPFWKCQDYLMSDGLISSRKGIFLLGLSSVTKSWEGRHWL